MLRHTYLRSMIDLIRKDHKDRCRYAMTRRAVACPKEIDGQGHVQGSVEAPTAWGSLAFRVQGSGVPGALHGGAKGVECVRAMTERAVAGLNHCGFLSLHLGVNYVQKQSTHSPSEGNKYSTAKHSSQDKSNVEIEPGAETINNGIRVRRRKRSRTAFYPCLQITLSENYIIPALQASASLP